MFRRLSRSLPEDPSFAADLQQLGYFINQDDQIRSISDTRQPFNYFISRNERVVQMQKAAMNACIRNNLAPRLRSAGLITARLPRVSDPADPHIPILVSQNISSCTRVVLYLGEATQDLGILSPRLISTETITIGSCLALVSEVHGKGIGREDTGIVIANLGQLIWSRRTKQAMTSETWDASPRKYGVSPAVILNPSGNRVPGNETAESHVARVFEYLQTIIRISHVPKLSLFIVGIGEGAEAAVRYLHNDWPCWTGIVAAIAVGSSYTSIGSSDIKNLTTGQFKNEAFQAFWSTRARAYLVHEAKIGTSVPGRRQMGCNCYASGESKNLDCVMPSVYPSILEFFRDVEKAANYEEDEIEVASTSHDGGMTEDVLP